MKKYCFSGRICAVLLMAFCATGAFAYDENEALSCNPFAPDGATFIAEYELIPYTITYNNMDGATNTGNPASYDIEHTPVTLTSPSKTGYSFGGWYSSSDTSGTALSAPQIPADSTGNKSFWAKWTPLSGVVYQVCHYTKDLNASTYTLSGGVCENQSGTTGATVTLASEAKNASLLPGFTYFQGYAGTSPVGTTPTGTPATETTILADGSRVISLYYSRDTHTVSLTKGTGVLSVTGAGTYEYGASVSVSGSCNSGYENLTWSSTPITTMGTSDVSYTANCSLVTYTIQYNLNDGVGSTTPVHTGTKPTTYNVETATFTVSNPTRPGYAFAGWTVTTAPADTGTGSVGLTANATSQTVTVGQGTRGNIVLTAQWTATTPAITYVDGVTNGTIQETTCTYDTNFTLPTAPNKPGYTFAGWTLQQ